MADKSMKWSLILVLLLSVLFPTGAYVWAIAVFITAILARRARQSLMGLFSDKPLLLLSLCVSLSIIYSRDIFMSLGAAVLLGINLGLYLVLAAAVRELELKKLHGLLNIICIIACLIGLYQYASGNLKVYGSWVDTESFGSIVRIYSTLLNPNIFAAYLAMNLSFAVAGFRSVKADPLLLLNISLASVCLLLTYSRGGFAAFGAAMLVLLLLKKRKRGLAIYSSAMAAAFFIMNSAGPNSRAALTSIYQDSSSLYRLEIWKAAWDMFLEKPILGNGLGTTWYYLSGSSDKLYKYILHCHNIYLHIATELGSAGLFAFLYMIGSRVWESFRLLKYRVKAEELYIPQGFLACTAGILVHGLIDAVIFVPAMSLVYIGYSSLYRGVAAKYPAERRLPAMALFEGKGIFELLWSKNARKDKYKEEESKACQA
jgi:O-antigen ligase